MGALAGEMGAKIVYEDFEGNPFLAASYTGEVDAALPSQIFYLMSRVTQLSQWTWPHEGLVVTDYGFCQFIGSKISIWIIAKNFRKRDTFVISRWWINPKIIPKIL